MSTSCKRRITKTILKNRFIVSKSQKQKKTKQTKQKQWLVLSSHLWPQKEQNLSTTVPRKANHDTIKPNTWQGVIHNRMVTIRIWIYNRISRVTWVSSVRQLQIWLKKLYRWSRKMIEVWKKWMGCGEQHYHEIDTQSRPKYPWNLQLELHKRENDKVIDSFPIGVSADSCPAGALWLRE